MEQNYVVVVEAQPLAEWLRDMSNLVAELKIEFGEVDPLLDTGLLTLMNSIDRYTNFLNKTIRENTPPSGEPGR